jgi:branched-chain amino acid transport system permease protein
MSSRFVFVPEQLVKSFENLNRIQKALLSVSVLGMVTLPFWIPTAYSNLVFVFALANIWAIFAMSWDILSGHTGYLSFGHSVISGSAAYTTGLVLLNVDATIPMYVTAPLSVGVAIVVGLLFAWPSLRLKGPYFSILTLLAVLIVVRLVFIFSEYTRGELGIGAVPVITYDNTLLFYLTLLPMLVIAALLLYISRSNIGMIFVSIRENEQAVEDAGIDTTKFKLWAFILSAVPMGMGGVMIAHVYGNVDPTTVLVLERTVEMILMVIIGGIGTIIGGIAGAYAFLFLRDFLFVELFGSTERWLALWIAMVLAPMYARDGVFLKLWNYLGDDEEGDT